MSDQKTVGPHSSTKYDVRNIWAAIHPVAKAAGMAAAGTAAAWLGYRAASRGSAKTPVTYPPLDVPKAIADDVWIVDSGPVDAMGMKLPVRMTIIRLPDGALLLHSPTRCTSALAGALRELGDVAHLLAPGIAHWIYLSEWQKAFPRAKTWGAPGLRDRRQVRRANVRIDADLEEQSPPIWADVLSQGIVRGAAGFCEVYFFHKSTGTLLLTDLIHNLEVGKLSPASALLMRSVAATSGTTALHVRALLLLGGRKPSGSIRSIIALAPERVIFAHGKWFDKDAAERLTLAFGWLPADDTAPSPPAKKASSE